jgi:hypothetical protein
MLVRYATNYNTKEESRGEDSSIVVKNHVIVPYAT